MATDASLDIEKPAALSLLRQEIFRFLHTDSPEVLCIRGKWGVGKTYTWETLLKEAQQAAKVKLRSYSYVSLFGLDSLDRFKSSVFENVIPVQSVGTDPTIETLGTNIKAVAKLAATAWKPGLGALADHAAFLAVNQYIVCIDDLERKGEKLRIVDVLGLVSLLRERRKCKIVLILNDEELSDADHAAFEKYSEKVIDSSLLFKPTSQEACDIAINGTTANDELLRKCAQQLDIANIRILKKLERVIRLVETHLDGLDDRIASQAVSTLVLFGWAVYAKKSGLLDYTLKERGRSLYGFGEEELPDEKKEYEELLDAYPFSHVDEFDHVLLDGIRAGFFDVARLLHEAKRLNENYANQTLEVELQQPWELYKDSFDDNGDEVCAALIETIHAYAAILSASYIESSVRFLKDMNREADALKIIAAWIEANTDKPQSFFDQLETTFPVQDENLRAALQERLDTFKDNRDPADVLFGIAENHGWNEEDIDLLSKLTSDDFYAMFTTLRGLKLRSAGRKALELGRQGGADPRYRAIGDNARQALRKLAEKSPINAQRVKKLYHVGPEDEQS
ncbi:hypothetical protein [Bradyrhizobium sp. SEMIA]|uniref:hypothetical protein n=1 Tax=Bradyrhizobium sp. SEMIA TaxID=2597515 RepID=UPI0018A5577D|nr:hypothetical protein [Bradyrhizobium sp. SEMIA]QOG21366.1 hypothetical protein FOM02_32690 [Bradyrhizobium sp. SEMIA]